MSLQHCEGGLQSLQAACKDGSPKQCAAPTLTAPFLLALTAGIFFFSLPTQALHLLHRHGTWRAQRSKGRLGGEVSGRTMPALLVARTSML